MRRMAITRNPPSPLLSSSPTARPIRDDLASTSNCSISTPNPRSSRSSPEILVRKEVDHQRLARTVAEGPSANAVRVAYARAGAPNGAIVTQDVGRRRSRPAFLSRAFVVRLGALSNRPRAFVVLIASADRPADRAIFTLNVGRSGCRAAVFLCAFAGCGRFPRRIDEVTSAEQKRPDEGQQRKAGFHTGRIAESSRGTEEAQKSSSPNRQPADDAREAAPGVREVGPSARRGQPWRQPGGRSQARYPPRGGRGCSPPGRVVVW